ncbi:MAG: InlB B-repeat-containing protein [Proteiniphilum sp.]|nr:InlB B-repeat-containing protein [Proteiniphilum sp.]
MNYLVIVAIAISLTNCNEKVAEIKVYTVTFDAYGGDPTPEPQRIEADGTVTAPTTNPAKQGYVFLFWHLNSANTAYDFKTPVNSDITLVAEWQEEATVEYLQVTWNLDGGVWPENDNHATEAVKGGTLAEPNPPTKTGKDFEGWYKEGALINKITFPYNPEGVTTNITLYASWTPVVTATRYYIDDTAGNDNNDGLSSDNAWKTLAKVNNNNAKFGPGDSILFKRGGSWTGHLSLINITGTDTYRITFGAYGAGDKPKLIGNAGAIPTVTIQNPKNVTFENFDISHISGTMPPQSAIRGIYVTIRNEGVYPNIVIKDNYVHDVEGQPVTNRHMQAGIFVRPEHDRGYFKNFLVEGNKLERCSARGILFGDNGGSRSYDYYNEDVKIRHNDVSYTALEGILLSNNSKNVLIEHNKVFYAGGYFPNYLDGVCLAALWTNAKDVIIQYNEVAHTQYSKPDPWISMDSEAFDIDVNSPGYQIIQYNYTHDNKGGFFLCMGNPGPDFEYCIIRYNISQNDGSTEFGYRTFELHGHINNTRIPLYIYNNTLYNDTKIAVQNRSTGAQHPGVEFKNNIFYAPSFQFDDPENIVYDNNLYYTGAKATNDAHAILSNPLLNGPGTGGDGMTTVNGYKLSSSSPAINAGVIMPNNGGKDYFGNPVTTSKPTIGAFQP